MNRSSNSITKGAKARTIKLTVEYDGTRFSGWQTQTARRPGLRTVRGRPKRTVQDEIEKVLKLLFKRPVKLTGSGRTDSGVHALGQVAHFKAHGDMPLETMRKALNANLPEDIAVVKAEEAPTDFHAQYGTKSKTYRYTVLNRGPRSARERDFCLHYPYPLNLRRMRAESRCLTGRHDFKAFTASDPAKKKSGKKENTVRTVKRIDIAKKGDYVTVDIEADGFLYKMVRNIVGALLKTGRGQLTKGEIKKILEAGDRGKAGNTAKAKGLALLKVRY